MNGDEHDRELDDENVSMANGEPDGGGGTGDIGGADVFPRKNHVRYG